MPRPTVEQYQSLKASVAVDGLLQNIEALEDGVIVDGHTRNQICEELGVDVPDEKVTVKRFADDTETKLYIIKINAKRRHLNDAQKAFVAMKIEELESVKAKQRQSEAGKIGTAIRDGKVSSNEQTFSDTIHARDLAAKQAGLSPTTYHRIKTVLKEASPELKQKVLEGKVKPSKAYHKIKTQKKREAYIDSLEPLTIETDRVNLVFGRFQDTQIEPESIDAIVTDPPYGKQFLHLWSDLAEFAAKVLKPTGILVTYTGQSYLPEKLKPLNELLKYFWCEALVYSKGQDSIQFGSNRLFSKWKPIFIFYKKELMLPPFTESTQYDIFFSGEIADHTEHQWKQSQDSFDRLIEKYTFENSLVCDPFAGTGTTLLSALKYNRRCVGIEANSETYKILEHNINKALGEENG